ncbi:uncharacterized protein EDB91DRAFT_1236156 [Suillus paluster]|uniref:uncharacterized protein n=1 Tax=Suillus paluster TaxID=48578 RepID=UPI001B883DA7|nr:uncharacterized protein EDB91DRAFT_1236156 [Suillus paluster]KAG1746760.1 hypothetical protein EDB91DRAFT_1236156 [Suillus paluster]
MPTLTPCALVYRHAAPSGPWPWVDFDIDFSSHESNALLSHNGASRDSDWSGYPQTLFGNWTPTPVERSKMLTKCARKGPCLVYGIDVMDDVKFNILPKQQLDCEGVQHGRGDHITVTLPFVWTTKKTGQMNLLSSSSLGTISSFFDDRSLLITAHTERKSTIDVLAPLHLHDKNVLLIDLLAVHMIRETDSSTIITYHPLLPGRTTAKHLHRVMHRTGDSVYWKKIFDTSRDPTFFFLAILWYTLYAWDEAFEVLHGDIGDLEATLNGMDFTYTDDFNHKLHSLQVHLLHYESLLYDFEKSVAFVNDTPNPAMKYRYEEDRKTTEALMDRECKNLLSEIGKLQKKCPIFLNLLFATVNIHDSRQTQKISYLTMVFLPASFTASVFGMNMAEINPGSLETIAAYVKTTLLLTFATMWVIIALQPYSSIHKSGGELDLGLERRQDTA